MNFRYREVESFLEQDSREKKQIARSAHNKKSRAPRGGSNVMMPVDLMSKQEREEYTRPKEVIKKMITSRKVFLSRSDDEREKILRELLVRNSIDEIATEWEIGRGAVISNIHKHNIDLSEFPMSGFNLSKAVARSKVQETKRKREIEVPDVVDYKTPIPFEYPISFKVVLKGENTGTELEGVLSALGLMLGKGKTYRYTIEAIEVAAVVESCAPALTSVVEPINEVSTEA